MSNAKPKPKIGIVSGFGPIAGIDVASKMHKYAAEHYGAVEDYEYPDFVLYSRGVEGFDKQGAINNKFKPAILSIVEDLNRFEVTIMGVACNTAHLFYDDIAKLSDAHVVNLVNCVVAKVAEKTGQPFLLLGSSTSRKSKLYIRKFDASGVLYVNPDDDVQSMVDQTIYLVMSHRLIEAGKKLDEIIESVESNRFTRIVLACTELPVAIKYSDARNKFTIVDSNEILAESLVDEYYKVSD